MPVSRDSLDLCRYRHGLQGPAQGIHDKLHVAVEHLHGEGQDDGTVLRHDAALWIVRPRGSSAITEGETRAAGLAAGLVDVKVVHFSDTHTAFKFVFRVRDR